QLDIADRFCCVAVPPRCLVLSASSGCPHRAGESAYIGVGENTEGASGSSPSLPRVLVLSAFPLSLLPVFSNRLNPHSVSMLYVCVILGPSLVMVASCTRLSVR